MPELGTAKIGLPDFVRDKAHAAELIAEGDARVARKEAAYRLWVAAGNDPDEFVFNEPDPTAPLVES